MTITANLPMEVWLEIFQSVERIELAKRLSLTNRLIHAAAHIRLHQEGEHVLGNLCFQKRQSNLLQMCLPTNDRHRAKLFKMRADGQLTKVPIADYELPANIVNFREIEIRLGILKLIDIP